MSLYRCLVPALACLALLAEPARAQESALADYHRLLPPMPVIVGETRASATLHLFGDSTLLSYRDHAPRDGMDDATATRLLALAERFSPILRRNNFSVPLDFARVPGRDGATLHVDAWTRGARVRSDSIILQSASSPGASAHPDDALLAAIVTRSDPRVRPGWIDPADRQSVVMYLDFPGHDERSWRDAYEHLQPADSRIYAHPFIEQDVATGLYRVAIQYWFFYPFNDGPNNHEGDWEHINVVLAWTESGRERPDLMTAGEIRRLLDPGTPLPVDELELGFVEYYFHESVVILEYRAKVEADRSASHTFEDGDWLSHVVAQRRAFASGRLATHPIGYIGANPTGPDELFTLVPRFMGSFNRNPHGTYPAPGLWQGVGAMGSTERVQGSVLPPVREDESLAWHELIDDAAWLTYPAERIVLMPDWERVVDLARHDAHARRRWAWTFLPIRFGYPIARSPGAGLVPHTDMGNIAPEGPAFQPTWNRLSDAGSPERYEPTVVRVALVSTTPWTGLQSGWGILNLPLFAAGLMPGYNVFLSQVTPWVTGALEIVNMPPPRTYYRGALPVRFSSMSLGLTWDVGGEELSRAVREPEAEGMVAAGSRSAAGTYRRQTAVTRRVGLTLYDGRRLSVENSFDWGVSGAGYQLADSTGARIGSVEGDLLIRELRGGFRYGLVMLPSGLGRLDARAGYGWTRFSSRNATVSTGAETGSVAGHDGGYLPTLLPSGRWWPNTWWVGAGAELFTSRDHWIGHTFGYGVRLDSALSFLELEDDLPGGGGGAGYARRVTSSVSVVVGW